MKFHHITWCSFTAEPYIMHALHSASSAHSFLLYHELLQLLTLYWPSIQWCTHFMWLTMLALFLLYHELFSDWTFYRPWTPWLTHYSKLHHITWCSFAAAKYVMHALSVASSAGSYCKLFSDYELPEAGTLEYFTTLPDAASLLHPMWCMHFVWWALLALFPLYCKLFSDHEVFTNCELT